MFQTLTPLRAVLSASFLPLLLAMSFAGFAANTGTAAPDSAAPAADAAPAEDGGKD